MPEVVQTETLVVRVKKLIDKNKAKAAFLAPLILALGSAGASWAITGEFNEAEVRTAAGGAIAAAAASLATYLTPSKAAEVEVTTRAAASPLTPTG